MLEITKEKIEMERSYKNLSVPKGNGAQVFNTIYEPTILMFEEVLSNDVALEREYLTGNGFINDSIKKVSEEIAKKRVTGISDAEVLESVLKELTGCDYVVEKRLVAVKKN